MNGRLFHFADGNVGTWQIVRMDRIVGDSRPGTSRLSMIEGMADTSRPQAVRCLSGIMSHARYATAQEKTQLQATQEGLGRPRLRARH
jgi:hypothetical protein